MLKSNEGIHGSSNTEHTHSIVDSFCRGLEFWARLILVNIPSYILASSPEFDRVCSVVQAYLLLQVVGLCWAFLVNSALSLACEWANFLPLSSTVNGSNTVRLVTTFYVSYASFRVVICFAQYVSQAALESMKDFPEAASILSHAGKLTLQLSPVIFIPAFVMEIGLIIADPVCHSSNQYFRWGCNNSGFYYLTSAHPEMRRLVFYTLIVMVVQLWQVLLNQFPRWDLVFRKIPKFLRYTLHLSSLFLSFSTVFGGVIAFADFFSIDSRLVPHLWYLMTSSLFGWTLWLFAFIPSLIHIQGEEWARKVTVSSLQQLSAQLRISLVTMLLGTFIVVCATSGLLQAQLDLTVITIAIPSLFIVVYLLAIGAIQAGPRLLLWGLPVAVIGAFTITSFSGLGGEGGTGRTVGNGSIILVALHLLTKMSQVWGDSGHSGHDHDSGWSREDEEEEEEEELTQQLLDGTIPTRRSQSDPNILLVLPSAKIAQTQLAERGEVHSSLVSLGLSQSPLAGHWLPLAARRYVFFVVNLWRQLLGVHDGVASNGSGSSYSKLSPNGFSSSHPYFADTSPRGPPLKSAASTATAVSAHTPTLSALLRIGTGLVVAVAAMLGAISVASVLQQDAGFFPDLMDFTASPDAVHFDHRVSNVTLFKRSRQSTTTATTAPPLYASCSWSWRGGLPDSPYPHPPGSGSSQSHSNYTPSNTIGMSMLDMAILSEIAYLSESPQQIQLVLDTLFPDLRLTLTHTPSYLSNKEEGAKRGGSGSGVGGGSESASSRSTGITEGPMYLEVRSEALRGTVMAVRGTDVGRLGDLLEDAKLYAEPVIFSLLGIAFPPMQLWSDSTAGAVVQLIHEATHFFGPLRPSAGSSSEQCSERSSSSGGGGTCSSGAGGEYYQPLFQRVMELKARGEEVIITGHSLGGGLAGVVGALAEIASISFASPGLGLSYRKFRARLADGSWRKLGSKAALHHRSLSVVTEFDWIPFTDRQVGLVQQIECDQPQQAHLNACHVLEGTICHLLLHCGDARQRFDDCRFSYDLGSVLLLPAIRQWAWKRRLLLLPLALLGPMVLSLAILPDLL